ncbi:MAG: polysaccharide biosynthesis C-terminal domain-containing protein [Terriglobia bacterium]
MATTHKAVAADSEALAATEAGVSVWSATASLGLTQALTALLQVANMALVSRLLGRQGLGLYAAFLASVTLLSLLADPLGYRWVNTYLVRRGAGVGTTLRRSSLYAGGVLVVAAFVFGLQSGWLVALLARLGLWARWEALEALLPLVALALPLLLFHGYVASILLGLEAYRDFNRLMLLAAASLTTANALLWLTLGRLQPRTAAALWAASYALAAAWGLLRLRQHGHASRSLATSETAFPEAAATGFRAFSVNLLSFLHLRVDIYLVGFFLAPAAVGLYAVAVALVELLARAPALLGTVIYPKSAGERAGEITRLIASLLKFLPALALVALPAFWLVGQRLIELLFGAAFRGSFTAAFWLLPGVIFLSGITLINNFLAGKGYPGVLHIAASVGLALNIVLNWLWIPRYGITGAALASSISYGLWLLLLVVHFRRCYLVPARN